MIRQHHRWLFITILINLLSLATPMVGAVDVGSAKVPPNAFAFASENRAVVESPAPSGWDALYPGEQRLLEEEETATFPMVGVWEGIYLTTGWKLGTISVMVRQEGGEYAAEVRMTNTDGGSITPIPCASGKLSDNEFVVAGSTPDQVTDAKWSSIDIVMSGEVEGDVWSGTLTRKSVIESRLEFVTHSGLFKLERSRDALVLTGTPGNSENTEKPGTTGGGEGGAAWIK